MSKNLVGILKPKTVSSGVSVCRTNDGFTLSAHCDDKRILLNVSRDECLRFAQEITRLCREG